MSYTYGLADVKTDDEGKLYFYLPSSTTSLSVTVNGTSYNYPKFGTDPDGNKVIPQKLPTPNATFVATSDNGGTLSVDSNPSSLYYSVNGGSSWSLFSGTSAIITGVKTANGIRLYQRASSDFNLDSDEQIINVTQAATTNLTPVQPITLNDFIPGKESTPNITIDYINEALVGFNNGTYKISFKDNYGNYSYYETYDITNGTFSIVASWLGKTIKIVKKGGEKTTDSDGQEVVIPIRPGAYTSYVVVMQPSTIGGAGANNFKSGDVNKYTIAINAFNPAKEATPFIQIDYINEKLTNFIPTGSYEIDGNVVFPIDVKLDIDETWMGSTISIVKKGNGTTTIDSLAMERPIKSRPAAPPVSGEIKIDTGGPLQDADIYVMHGAAIIAGLTRSDSQGRYMLNNVPAGRHILVAERTHNGDLLTNSVEISIITERELFVGIGNNKFAPHKSATRSEIAQLIKNLITISLQ